MSRDLSGKAIAITGASSGIGEAIELSPEPSWGRVAYLPAGDGPI